jgi:hypothetical protein
MFFKPDYKPGVNKRETSLQNEGGYGDSDRVRFKDGMPQPIGGWFAFTVAQFQGLARGAHAWRTLESVPVFAFGTQDYLYANVGGSTRDITPPLHEIVLEDCFTTVSGSDEVTVHLDFHTFSVGDTFTFSNHQSTAGGLNMNGTWTVLDVPTENTFTFTHTSNAGSTASTPTGGFVDFYAALPAGLLTASPTGYGSSSYGVGAYGAASNQENEVRTWTIDNWGEFGVFNPTGFGIYQWQPEIAYPDLAFNGDFAGSADGWALGTGWAYGSNSVDATAGTGSNLSQDVTDIAQGGRVYRVTFDVTVSAGSIKFQVNAGTTPALVDVAEASSDITVSGSYSRVFVCPADPVDFVFAKDSAFAGSISNVTYAIESKATRITTAPPKVDAMFVDPRGLMVALGTTLVDGTFAPTSVRTSDLGNNASWVPDVASYASEYVLRGGGGRIVCGLATAEQNLVWGGSGVFSLQYKGAIADVYEIKLLGTKCGAISRHCVTEMNGFVTWMSNTNQFYIFRGVGLASLGKPEVIDCPIQEDIFDNIDVDQVSKVYAGANPEFTEMWFMYPDARDGDECSRVAALNWTTGTWVTHTIGRTSWIADGIFENPLGFTTDSIIMSHEAGTTDNGANLNAWVETSYFDTGEGDELLTFHGIIPDIKNQVGNMGWTIKGKMEPHGTEINFGQYTSTPTDPRVNFRVKARQLKVRMDWLTTGGNGRLGAIRYILNTSGAKK